MTYSPMPASEWLKYDWRIPRFIDKYKEGIAIELVDGNSTIFEYNEDIVNILLNRDRNDLNKLYLTDIAGNKIKLSKIGKTSYFGGRGQGSGTIKEDLELSRIKKVLKDLERIKIRLDDTIHEVIDVESTPGTPKSDFHFIDENGEETIWISHKAGSKPKDFQQWGGVSKRIEPKINAHPEVQEFIHDLTRKYPNGMPRKTALFRKIRDNDLKMMSVYGNEYGSKLSRQNVSVLVQGEISLVDNHGEYMITSNHVHLNGEDITGEYEPVLTAVYKGDRNDGGILGARITIQSIGARRFNGDM